jgi:hypothetical protein
MPHLPAEQAEYQYMLNRTRMDRMKASGEIQVTANADGPDRLL